MIRKFIYQELKPISRLVKENTYLDILNWCFRRCLPLCRLVLHCYRNGYEFQLTPSEIALVLRHLKKAKNFLVFGVGQDSPMWMRLGPANTSFIEHDAYWVEQHPELASRVCVVKYSTLLEQHTELLTKPQALHLGLSPEIDAVDWDLILVDSPPGYKAGTPGRMQSICAASKLVRPGGIVLLHDIDREAEQIYAARYLGVQRARVGALGMFRANWSHAPPFQSEPKSHTKNTSQENAPRPPRFRLPGAFSEPGPDRIVPYYSDDKVEINIVNWHEGMRIKPRHDREVLLVRDPWYPEIVLFSTLIQWMHSRGHDNRVYFLSNTIEIHRARRRLGLNSHFINVGCFINEHVFRTSPAGTQKRFDAAMVSRYSWYKQDQFKRHFLTTSIERLALIDPVYASQSLYYRDHYTLKANCAFSNSSRLDKPELVQLLWQSHCGLILSSLEGICRASSEYLLCGMPVVSTHSVGGRDVWYDDYNAIIVEPDSTAVAEAVEQLKREPRDPEKIRSGYLEKANKFRNRFVSDVLTPIFQRFDARKSPQEVFESHRFRWWPGE